MTFLVLGRLLLICHQDISVRNAFSPTGSGSSTLIACLESDPVTKPRSFKCTALIRFLCGETACYREKEKIFIYFEADRLPEKMTVGSLVIFSKPLLAVENTGNMAGFDYKAYCRLKHIQAQVFLRNADYRIIGKERHPFSDMLQTWRKKILRIIRLYIRDPAENGLMEALMIGYTADLDRDLLQDYSNTGVVHIIAISGLHLALIYHILQLLLRRLTGSRLARWSKFLILMCALWTFSLLSGASPSVIRSAMMFSFLLLAQNISRESLIYNSLAASAFLLLCFDPFWLWDTGFQLSYLAVLGLVVFSKSIQALLPVRNRLLRGLWNAASVSLAAQILTTPISIYYFHRFPNYFLFSNLLAVPLSSCILIGGILLCLLSFCPAIAHALGWLLSKGIAFLNGFVQYTAHLPGAVTGQLSLQLIQVFALYLLIWCLYRYYSFPKW